MSQPYEEALADTFTPTQSRGGLTVPKDLLEVAGLESPGSSMFGIDNCSNSRTYIIESNKKRSFTRYMLGAVWADEGYPYKLHRENPKADPEFPHLRASTVQFHDITAAAAQDYFKLDGTQVIGGDRNVIGNLKPVWQPTFVATPASLPDSQDPPFEDFPDVIPFHTRYRWTLATVGFVTYPPYPMFRDHEIESEFDRNVYWEPTPTLDILSANSTANPALRWAESNVFGPGGPVPPAGPKSGPTTDGFPSPTGLFIPRISYVAHWGPVAREFIFNDELRAPRFEAAIGRVNESEWGGWKKGTALLMGAKFTAVTGNLWCGPTTDGRFGASSHYNVDIFFKYFNPALGYDFPLPGAPPRDVNLPFGWQLQPFRDGLWYYATRDGNTTGEPPLPYYDFASDLLRHWAAP